MSPNAAPQLLGLLAVPVTALAAAWTTGKFLALANRPARRGSLLFIAAVLIALLDGLVNGFVQDLAGPEPGPWRLAALAVNVAGGALAYRLVMAREPGPPLLLEGAAYSAYTLMVHSMVLIAAYFIVPFSR